VASLLAGSEPDFSQITVKQVQHDLGDLKTRMTDLQTSAVKSYRTIERILSRDLVLIAT